MITPQKPQALGVDSYYHQPLPPDTFILHNRLFSYPSLLKRYKAMLIDALILLTILIIVMVAIGDHENRAAIMLILVSALSFYEPLLTKYAGTVGQRVMGIRVRDYNAPSKPIGFWQAYIRAWIKAFLGWLSFITIRYNREHRAIHDVATSTVVIMLTKPHNNGQ